MDKPSLELRFKNFLMKLPGSENIDEVLTPNQKRADFLLNERRVILELKSLEGDPEYKIDERLEPYRNLPEFPFIYGGTELKEIVSRLPNGEKIRQEIVHALTRSIQTALEKADDQIFATKKSLGLSKSSGLVVILNQSIEVLTPHLIMIQVKQMLTKKKPDNQFRYRHIGHVIVLSECHSAIETNGIETLSVLQVKRPNAKPKKRLNAFLKTLTKQWCISEGYNLNPGQKADLDNILKFQPRSKHVSTPLAEMPRYERWRSHYRQNPYLMPLSDEQFSEYARRVFVTVLPYFLKGNKRMTPNEMDEHGQKWTHVLEESSRRRMDLREIQRTIHESSEFKSLMGIS